MQEHQRLQKIREIGIRLHELGLVSKKAETSYASLAINYLFSLYKMQKPSGVSLQETLQQLAEAVVLEHKLAYRRLSADSVLDFFSHRYQVSAASALVHPSYRRRNTAGASLQFA